MARVKPEFAGLDIRKEKIAPIQSPIANFADSFRLNVGLAQAQERLEIGFEQNDFAGSLRDMFMPSGFQQSKIYKESFLSQDYDPNYNPIRDEDWDGINPEMMEELGGARNKKHFNRILVQGENNDDRRNRLKFNDAGWSSFLGGVADPVNLIPIPFALGRGFWNGIKAAAPLSAATVTGAELVRHNLDPTSTLAETAINIAAGTLLSTGIGGLAGEIPKWMGKGAHTRAAEHYVELQQRMQSVSDTLAGKSFADRNVSRGTFEKDIAPHLPKGTTYEDYIKGVAQDGLPSDVIRLQANAKAGESLGERIIVVEATLEALIKIVGKSKAKAIMKDIDGDYVVLTSNGKKYEVTATGKLEEISAKLNELELRRVDSFSARQAIDFGRTQADEVVDTAAGGTKKETADEPKEAIDSVLETRYEDNEGFTISPENTPDEIVNRARERVDAEQLDAETVISLIQDELAAMIRKQAELRSKAKGHKHKATASRLKNQAEALNVDITHLQAKKGIAQGRLQEITDRVIRADNEGDISLFDIKTTHTALEDLMGKGAQFPFYRLKKNKLRQLAPELAAEWQELANEIAGSPGLFDGGNQVGIRSKTSVEMYAKQWSGKLHQVRLEADSIYLQYAGYDGSSTPGKMYWLNAEERLNNKIGGKRILTKRKDAAGSKNQDEDLLSYDEFRDEVSAAIIANGKHSNASVRKAANLYHDLFNRMGKEAENLNMFHSRANLEKRVEILETRINRHKEKFQTATPALRKMEDELIDTQEMLESVVKNPVPESDDWFYHRVWIPNKISENEDALRGLLTAWFKNPRGNHAIINGRVVKFSTDPIKIAARVEEALITLKREANFNDTLGLMDTGDKLSKTIARRDGYKNQVKEMKAAGADPKDIAILEARIDILDGRIGMINPDGTFVDGDMVRKMLKERDALREDMQKAIADGKEIDEVQVFRDKIEEIEDMISGGSAKTIGGPNALMSRRLNIPNDFSDGNISIRDFIETDINTTMSHYVNRMGPAIEMARKFGDTRMSPRIDELTDKIDELIESLAGADPARAKALLDEKKMLVQAAEDLRDKVLGVYGIPENPDALSHRVVRMLMAFNTLTAMGRAWMTAIPDVGNTLGVHVFAGIFGDTSTGINGIAALRGFAEVMKDGRSKWQLAAREVTLAGEALEITNATRFSQITEVPLDAYSGSGFFGKLERAVYGQQSPFFLLNLLAPWTDQVKRFSGAIAQSRMIEDSLLLVEGKLSKTRIEELARLGIDSVTAQRFVDQWRFAGGQKGKTIFLANTEAWADQTAVREFRAMLAQEVNSMIVTPGAADKPNILSKDWAKVVGQYHSFSISATQRIMMANLQRRDMRAVSAIASMIALSWMVDNIKRPDYIEMDIEDQLFRAVEMSGVTGIFSDLNQAIEKASGGELGARAMMGLKNMERDPHWASRLGTLGAVPSQYLALLYPFVSDDATAKDMTKGIRYMIPYNNLWAWNSITNRMQRTATDVIEDFEE